MLKKMMPFRYNIPERGRQTDGKTAISISRVVIGLVRLTLIVDSKKNPKTG